jgi:hypothetical protein
MKTLLPGAMTLVVMMVAIGGCRSSNDRRARAALDLLEQADQFELLSLDPVFYPNRPKAPVPKFHDWAIIGKASITSVEVRNKLIDALRNAVVDPPPGKVGCFNPRHGIHAVYKGDSIDLVICFECEIVLVYTNEEESSGFHINSSPKAIFYKTLLDAGVSLAPGSL